MAAMENDFENTTISLYGTVPDSIVDGKSIYACRYDMGRKLALECPVEADMRAAPKRRWRPFWPIFAPTASCTT